MHAACLALMLHRLPTAYQAALGRLDTVHVLLLGLLLGAGAAAGLALARAWEARAREAWVAGRRHRAALMSAASTSSSGTSLERQ